MRAFIKQDKPDVIKFSVDFEMSREELWQLRMIFDNAPGVASVYYHPHPDGGRKLMLSVIDNMRELLKGIKQ